MALSIEEKRSMFAFANSYKACRWWIESFPTSAMMKILQMGSLTSKTLRAVVLFHICKTIFLGVAQGPTPTGEPTSAFLVTSDETSAPIPLDFTVKKRPCVVLCPQIWQLNDPSDTRQWSPCTTNCSKTRTRYCSRPRKKRHERGKLEGKNLEKLMQIMIRLIISKSIEITVLALI